MSTLNSSTGNQWFVIHTHVKQENRAEANLRSYQVETFTPRMKEYRRNPYSGALSPVIKPLFPGYIFARLEFTRFAVLDLIHRIKFTGGVHSLVSFAGNPAVVYNQTIDIIRSRIGEDGLVKLYDELKPGDEVLVQEGPFRNFVGVFDRGKRGSDRIIILLNNVSYQPFLEIRRAYIRKLV